MPKPMRKTRRCRSLYAAAVSFAAATVAAALCPSAALAQSGARLLLEPFPKEQAVDISADGYFLDNGHTQEADEDFSLRVYESLGRVRLKPGDVASPRVGWEFLYLDLDTDDPSLPDQLVDQSVGFATPIAKSGDWVFALSAGFGYAGDTPFGDGDAWYPRATFVALTQPNETSAFVFVLDYDRNRTFLPDVPLPGFVYTGRVSDRLLYTIGLPVSSVTWKPDDRWTLTATYLVPYTLDADVSYEVVEGLSLYGKLESRYEAFFIDGLEENYHRLFFEQRRAEAGVRWTPREGMNVTVGAGYAWGGEFSTGWDLRETDEVTDISDEPYVKAGIEFQF